MRVLHVTPYFAPAFAYGGPPRAVLGLCRALMQTGVDVRVVTTNAAGGRERLTAIRSGFSAYDGVPVHYAPLRWPAWYFNAALQPILDEGLAWCDVCHIHGIWNFPEWLATHRATGRHVPYVVSPRGMLEPEALKRGRARKVVAWRVIERGRLAGASVLHATSEQEASTLRVKLPDARIAMQPNGVDLRAAAEAVRGTFRRRLGVCDTDPIVVSLGRLHAIKRLDLLAAAFGRLREAWPRAKLVIAGRDEQGRGEAWKRLFRQAGVEAIWTGELDDEEKWALLADASALVCCSDSESFGTSVAEALAAGVPVVVTQTCPWPRLAEWGCGHWVPQTAGAIADALARLFADPEEARRMGERGRIVARDRFSWSAIGSAMAGVYAELAGSSPASVERAAPE